jgi:hypothetical protein
MEVRGKTLLMSLLKTAWEQITGIKQKPKSWSFQYTKHGLAKMQEYNVTQWEMKEVIDRPSKVKGDMVIREYNGYHIGLICQLDSIRRTVLIISCWKRKNRY